MYPARLGIFIAFLTFLFSGISTTLFAQSKVTTVFKKDSLTFYDELILDRITVIGKPEWMERIPGSASYVGFEKLQKQNYSDVNRILRSVSGVNIQEEDGFGLRPNVGLRGTGVERSSKITLMEDGVLIAPAPYAAPAAYYFPTVGRMSSVEVRKGSSQIKSGPNTTGGAINLISTRIPYELDGMAEVSVGEYSTRNIHAYIGNTYKNVGFLVETYQAENDGFKDLDFGGNTGYDTKDYLAKLMFRTNPDAGVFQKVEFKAGIYDEISNETYLGLTDADFRSNPYRRYAASQKDQMDAEHQQLQARHFVFFPNGMNVTTTVYRNDFKRNWYKLDRVNGVGISGLLENPQDNASAYAILQGGNSGADALAVKANNREYYSQGIQSVVGYDFDLGKARSEFQLGFRYHEDEMDRYQWVDGYEMDNGAMVRTSQGTPGTESNRIESARAISFYVQDRIVFDKWSFMPGVRYETIDLKRENFGSNDPGRTGTDLSITEKTVNVFVPGLGVNYFVSDEINIFAGVHKGFSPPSPGSAKEAKAEQSVNYELGTRFQRDALSLELVGFFNDYSNLLGTDLAAGGGGGSTQQFNGGEVDVIGAEVGIGYDIAGSNLSYSIPFNLNYTFTHATFQNAFESGYEPWGTVEKGYELPYLPRHQINLSVGYERGDYAVNLNTYATGKMRTVSGSGDFVENQSTDAYLLMDLAGSYQVTNFAKVFVNIRNLTDQAYIVSRRPAGVRPGLPQTVMGGLRLDL